ncbi:hypothetical protein BDZ94DRAFT_303200 [Collybia nuda]|uniref:Transmembrane protein n=1 Tax=Collybia nuda TaxID=64659 RepID=A0A9P5Y9C6_9AGAR|nr:hypothetical protein BDZ94DRAFT_303200 [Collybia nuda]
MEPNTATPFPSLSPLPVGSQEILNAPSQSKLPTGTEKSREDASLEVREELNAPSSSRPPSDSDESRKSGQSYQDPSSGKEGSAETEQRHSILRPSIHPAPVEENELTPNPEEHSLGGRATPRHQRFQYQPSHYSYATSDWTEVDGVHRSSHSVHSYIANNPFLPSVAQTFGSITSNVEQSTPYQLRSSTPTTPHSLHGQLFTKQPTATQLFFAFLSNTLPRQVYLHLQLRLPTLYFSRVARVFEDTELSMPDIRRMAVSATNQWKEKAMSIVNSNWNFEPSLVPTPISNLKLSWEGFIDSLMREWKTLNLVSVLLLSAILTILQIEAAAADPLTRYFALASLVCALMSLLYGCMFIIRFSIMRKVYKAAEWAEEAQKT